MPTRDDVLEELGLQPVFLPKKRVAAAAPKVQKAVAAENKSAPKGHTALHDARAEKISQMSWDALVAEIAQCTACKLCETRTNTVPGEGARDASWMLVGEAPGADEDASGQPFVGRSGKLLDSMFRSVGRARATNLFIVNTLKCRPPDNRNPEPDELAACAPFLKRQIALAQPKLLFTVGKFAAMTITGSDEAIGAMRGKTYAYEGIPVRVTYHPSYLMRSPLEKAKAWDDLLAAKKMFDTPNA